MPNHLQIDVMQEVSRRLAQYDEAIPLLHRAMEELRLIRMKDCGSIYDTTLRVEYEVYENKWRRCEAP